MPTASPLDRLLRVLQPSLAMYVADSGIWSYPGKESIKLALADLVGDQRSMIERAAVALEDRGTPAGSAVYPIAFSGCHDVDLRSLLPRILAELRGQTRALDAIIAAGADPVACELAAEARASAHNHIGVLEQVASVA
jgi:hypothetical protein